MFKSLRPIRSNFYILRRMSTKNDNLNIPGLLAEEHKSLKNMIEADNQKIQDGHDLQAAMKHLKVQNATDKDSLIKNFSLQILDVQSPAKILDIYEQECMGKEALPEQLFLLLFFFKSLLRDIPESSAVHIVNSDARLKTLIEHIMKVYTPNIDFAYQISTILSLTQLMSLYEFQSRNEWKNHLVNCLKDVRMQDGAFILEVPSLVFCLHQIATDENFQDLVEVCENLTAIYLQTIGDRIDPISASNLIYGLAELELQLEEHDLIDEIARICLQKHEQDAFYQEGCSTELVNIFKSSDQLQYKNDKFNHMVLKLLASCFEDLEMSWINTFLRTLSSTKIISKEQSLQSFTEIAGALHKRLQKSFEKKTAQSNIVDGKNIEIVPDLNDYSQLWQSLQLLAAKKPNSSASSAIKLIANDLIKIFNGNQRWHATDMNINEAALISSGLALIKVENEKFVADLADVVRHNIKKAEPGELCLLTVGAFYMRKFHYCQDLYALVHSHCMMQQSKFSPAELNVIKDLYTKHDVISDSPFVQARVQR